MAVSTLFLFLYHYNGIIYYLCSCRGNNAIISSAYRKRITSQQGNADRSDGIVYTSNSRPYEIGVVEGSKPYEDDCDKETADFIQNCRAAEDIINYLVIQEVRQKRPTPTLFRSYMVQVFEFSIRFYFTDYLSMYRYTV